MLPTIKKTWFFQIFLTVVVTFRGELQEPEEQGREVSIVHVLLSGRTIGSDTQTLGFGVALEGVQVKHGGGAHEASDGREEAGVPLVFKGVQHLLQRKVEGFITTTSWYYDRATELAKP